MNNEIGRLNIGDQERIIKVNMAFTRYLNDKYETPETKGIAMGINSLVVQLEQYSPEALIDVIKAGTETDSQKPQTKDIISFLDEQDDLEYLFNMAIDGIKKSPITRLQTEAAYKRYEKVTAAQEKQLASL